MDHLELSVRVQAQAGCSCALENCHRQHSGGREEVWGISSSPTSSAWQGGQQKLNEKESSETTSTPPRPPSMNNVVACFVYVV